MVRTRRSVVGMVVVLSMLAASGCFAGTLDELKSRMDATRKAISQTPWKISYRYEMTMYYPASAIKERHPDGTVSFSRMSLRGTQVEGGPQPAVGAYDPQSDRAYTTATMDVSLLWYKDRIRHTQAMPRIHRDEIYDGTSTTVYQISATSNGMKRMKNPGFQGPGNRTSMHYAPSRAFGFYIDSKSSTTVNLQEQIDSGVLVTASYGDSGAEILVSTKNNDMIVSETLTNGPTKTLNSNQNPVRVGEFMLPTEVSQIRNDGAEYPEMHLRYSNVNYEILMPEEWESLFNAPPLETAAFKPSDAAHNKP